MRIIIGRRDVCYKEARRYKLEGKEREFATEKKAGDECHNLTYQLEAIHAPSGAEIQAAIMSVGIVRFAILSERAERLRNFGRKNEAAENQCAAMEMRYVAEQIGKLVA